MKKTAKEASPGQASLVTQTRLLLPLAGSARPRSWRFTIDKQPVRVNAFETVVTFSGQFWKGVARPLFMAHPDVAPEEWLRVNAHHFRRRRG